MPTTAYDTKEITHAHLLPALPRAVRPRLYTLACKRCNSQAGSRQDRQLIDYARVAWPRANPAPIQVGLDINGEKVRAELTVEESRLHRAIRIEIGNANNRDVLRRVDGYLASRPRSIKAGIRFDFDPSAVACGLLTAAYLNAFRVLGYWYILNETLDPIREQILRPDVQRFAERAVFQLEASCGATPAMFLVTEPARLRCIVFRYEDRMVILPRADDRALAIYDEMERFMTTTGRLGVNPEPFTSLAEIGSGMRAGPVTADADDEVVAVYAYPDLGTVNRVFAPHQRPEPEVDELPDWVPSWAHVRAAS
jgi:hypothetical protein